MANELTTLNLANVREWWRNLTRIQKRRLMLVMIIPTLGLGYTTWSIIQVLRNDEPVQAYKVAPPPSVLPSSEKTLFSPTVLSKTPMLDDVFIGSHKQAQQDIIWLKRLDLTEAKKYGEEVYPEIETMQERINPETIKKTSPTQVTVKQVSATTTKATFGMDYDVEDAESNSVSGNTTVSAVYRLTYEIQRAENDPTAVPELKLISLSVTVSGEDSQADDPTGFGDGEELVE